jgi:hypothetical protein
MEREKVNSSMFISVGYDLSSKIIELEFKNGKIYQHFDVPENIFTSFKNASSLGKFYNRYIKGKFSSSLIK